nr:type IV pilin protein [Vibrio sp. JPW-9-11-11]
MTLIELIVVVAIIALLASIAYPNYQNYLLRAQRITAMADLALLQLELERRYQTDYQQAAEGILSEHYCYGCQSDTTRFRLDIETTENSYLIIATPLAIQQYDRCGQTRYVRLSVDHRGKTSPQECWH